MDRYVGVDMGGLEELPKEVLSVERQMRLVALLIYARFMKNPYTNKVLMAEWRF